MTVTMQTVKIKIIVEMQIEICIVNKKNCAKKKRIKDTNNLGLYTY